MDNLTVKDEKEAFVRGLNGTTLLEVTVIINYAFVTGCLRALLLAIAPLAISKSRLPRFVLEWLTIVFPFVAVTTVLADDTQLIFATCLFLTTSTAILLPSVKSRHDTGKTVNINHITPPTTEELLKEANEFSDQSDLEDEREKVNAETPLLMSKNMSPFITTFRAYTTIISCVCILAVDFKAFPRRLAKTEVFGSGLMDTGVGFFVVCNGIVSPEARGRSVHSRTISDMLSRVRSTMLSSWPLWLIGVGRMVSVKLLNYQEHVSEYGVHWNFFFTLAVVKIAATIILLFINTGFCFLLSAALIGVYQVALLHASTDVTSLILNDDRDGFFMANKEGIFSCIGYLSLYFASVQAGVHLFKTERPSVWPIRPAFFKLLFVDALLWTATVLSCSYIQPISRRFANFSFVLWMLAISLEFFLMYIVLDFGLNYCVKHNKLPLRSLPDQCVLVRKKRTKRASIKYDPPPPPVCIMNAVNRNMFFYFLLSNLVTGLVNHLFNTIELSDTKALMIISTYTFFTLLPVWFLHLRQVSVKFW